MDTKETRSILAEHLARYRSRSYAELAAWVRDGRIDTPEAIAPSGNRYQIELQFFWDDEPNGDVRVSGSISDSRGIRAFLPLTDSFILSRQRLSKDRERNKYFGLAINEPAVVYSSQMKLKKNSLRKRGAGNLRLG
jgi:hypothetical protein